MSVTLGDLGVGWCCPTCAHGAFEGSRTFTLGQPPERGTGKVWAPSTGNWNTTGTGRAITCPTCGGSGLVPERRTGPADRRAETPAPLAGESQP